MYEDWISYIYNSWYHQSIHQLVADEKNMATHLAMQKACARAHANMTGLRICAMAAKTYCRPAVPPGRKLIRYHNRATNWAADDPITMT